MKQYEMLVTWTMCEFVKVKAPSKKKAVEKAYDMKLPHGYYCDDSTEVHEHTVKALKTNPKATRPHRRSLNR